jgi:predicted metal-dependent peptidase
MFTTKDLSALMSRARTYLPQMEPYLYVVPVRIETDAAKCPTAYTTGREIVLGAEFMSKRPAPAQLGLLLHEVMHLVRGDVWAHRTRDRKLAQRWNVAADIVLEGQIAQMALTLCPDVPVDDNPVVTPNYQSWVYTPHMGKSMQQVFDELVLLDAVIERNTKDGVTFTLPSLSKEFA